MNIENVKPTMATEIAPAGQDLRGFYEAKAVGYRTLDSHVGDREQCVLDLFPARQGLRVMDAGCGSGRFLRILQRLGHDAIGVDISESAVRTVCESGGKAHRANPETGEGMAAVAGDVDVITALDVLEHSFDPARVMANLGARLKPDGCLIVSVPNIACITARLTILMGNFPTEPNGIFDAGHIRWFTKSNLPDYVQATGNLQLAGYTGVPIPTFSRWGLWRLERSQFVVLRWLARHWPSLWAYQHVFKLVPRR